MESPTNENLSLQTLSLEPLSLETVRYLDRDIITVNYLNDLIKTTTDRDVIVYLTCLVDTLVLNEEKLTFDKLPAEIINKIAISDRSVFKTVRQLNKKLSNSFNWADESYVRKLPKKKAEKFTIYFAGDEIDKIKETWDFSDEDYEEFEITLVRKHINNKKWNVLPGDILEVRLPGGVLHQFPEDPDSGSSILENPYIMLNEWNMVRMEDNIFPKEARIDNNMTLKYWNKLFPNSFEFYFSKTIIDKINKTIRDLDPGKFIGSQGEILIMEIKLKDTFNLIIHTPTIYRTQSYLFDHTFKYDCVTNMIQKE